MKPTLFTGSGVALATPFTSDGVDIERLRKNVCWQIESGTDALIVLGTTGEPATMTRDEKQASVKAVLETAGGRVPVIVGVGSNDTRTTIEQARWAEGLGAQGLLVVTPYYNRPSQQGLVKHYMAVADAATLPIIAYNVPARTGVNLLPETLGKLARHERIVGLKEANGNLPQLAETINETAGNMAIYSGNDDSVTTIMAMGGAGVISVAANVIPAEMHRMAQSFLDGDVEASRNLQLKFTQLIKLLFIEPSPAPLKCAMRLMGIDSGILRLPLTDIALGNQALMEKELLRLGLLH